MVQPSDGLRPVYFEGRCRLCGVRVTVEREYGYHRVDGKPCGPVETERPFVVRDQPVGRGWVVRASDRDP